MSAELVEFPERNLKDIPATLERFAATMRAGDHGTVTRGAGVFIDEDTGDLMVLGWGDTDALTSIGLLAMGQAWLAANLAKR